MMMNTRADRPTETLRRLVPSLWIGSSAGMSWGFMSLLISTEVQLLCLEAIMKVGMLLEKMTAILAER